MSHQEKIKIHATSQDKWIFPFPEFHQPGKPVLPLVGDQIQSTQEFNQKISNGAIAFESLPCLCTSTDFNLLASYDRYGMRQSTVVCTQCGLIQSNPRMTKEAYFQFYSSDTYRRCYDSSDYMKIYEDKYVPAMGKHIFEEIKKVKSIGAGVSVLEIGAGGGWNLLVFQEAGAKVCGYEYSPNLVVLGGKHGVPMVQGSADDIQGEFDIIFLNHVWEHLLDPVGALKKMKQHLKKDGIIYLAVPNIYNGMLFQFQNAHTYYFDPKTFHHYASSAGLTMTAFGPAEESHMFGIFKPGQDPRLPDLKEHYKEVSKFFRFVRTKRRIKILLRTLGVMR